MKNSYRIIEVTTTNVEEHGIFCLKNKKEPGYQAKVSWFLDKMNDGLQIKVAYDDRDKQVGFIEYIPSEKAWRPIRAKNQIFIQCIAVFNKKARQQGLGMAFLTGCESDARAQAKSGLCAMTSDGPWMATSALFEKAGYIVAEKKGRFELMYKPLSPHSSTPTFFDWEQVQQGYQGWHLVYSDQCPWHDKAVIALGTTAGEFGIDLTITKLDTPQQAQRAPSGFGTFSLLRDGRLLEDHYISKTRFLNILKKELA